MGGWVGGGGHRQARWWFLKMKEESVLGQAIDHSGFKPD